MQDLPTWLLLLSILANILVLAFSADKMVDGATALALHTGISPLVIGITIISLGTTMPEMVVSVFASFYNESSLALGNAVGSIIADTALIMGLLIFLGHVVIDWQSSFGTLWWRDLSATAIVIIAWLMPDHILPRWIGLLLLVLLAVFLFHTYWRQIKSPKQTGPKDSPQKIEEQPEMSRTKSIIFLLLGLLFMVASSRILLSQVSLFALRIGVSKDIIATTLVAFGTSLPELTTTFAAIRKKKEALGIGNIMGADILNALFVIGSAAATKPIQVEPAFFQVHFPVMLLVLWSMRLNFIGRKRPEKLIEPGKLMEQWHIPKWYGLSLILIYAGYIALQYVKGVEKIH